MSSMNPRPHPESGFTLLEVLLAVAILAMVSALVSVSFATTFRVRDRALEDAGREHLARNALRLMADELVLGRTLLKFRWTGVNADQDGRPADLLAFSTSAQSRVQPNIAESDVSHVAYTRQKDRLVRYSLRNPYAQTVEAVDRTEIADGVLGFNVRYFDRRQFLWFDQWGEGPAMMPSGVLIELTMAGPQQSPRTYTAWISTALLASAKP